MKIEWDRIGGIAYFALGVGVLVVIPVVLAWFGLGLIGMLLALPVIAWLASRVLVHGGASALTWFSRKPLEEWQGNYYAFNDIQVRVFEEEGALLFVADDVVMAVGLPGLPESFRIGHPKDLRTIPGTKIVALDPAGVEHLLGKRIDPEAMRFLLWMRREVVAPWEKRK